MRKDKKENTVLKIVTAIKRRHKSFTHAGRGLQVIFTTQINFRIECALFMITLVGGLFTGLYLYEWLFIILSFGILLALESVNTAFEIDIDLTSPNYHPFARDVKDVAAGAVLIAALMTGIGLLVIFYPKFF